MSATEQSGSRRMSATALSEDEERARLLALAPIEKTEDSDSDHSDDEKKKPGTPVKAKKKASRFQTALKKKPRAVSKPDSDAERPHGDGVMRGPPMFQEVVWNEYCVLFPDGTHTPFNDEVRYTNLKGYLRKRPVVKEVSEDDAAGKPPRGSVQHAIQYGAPRRGWHRHYIYVNLKWLAWFEHDPEEDKAKRSIAESFKCYSGPVQLLAHSAAPAPSTHPPS